MIGGNTIRKICKPYSRLELRNIAHLVRDRANTGVGQQFPAIRFFESALHDLDYSLEIIDEETAAKTMGHTYAETLPREKIVRVRESVYLGAIENIPRDVFTIVHELCHVILHGKIYVSFARNGEKVPFYADPEWQANTCAAEILAPADELQNMEPKEICIAYGVSKKVAQIQSSHAYKISS